MEKYYLWLLLALGENEPCSYRLLSRFGDAKAVYDAFINNIAAAGAELTEKALSFPIEKAAELLSDLETKAIDVIIPENPLYPEALKSVEEPPFILFAKGNTALLKNKLLTAVGSRDMTDETAVVLEKVIQSLGRKYTLVSTLSVGCDQLTFLSAYKYKTPFIEVLPCGFDNPYPKGSETLRKFLLDNGGLVITEFLPETKASNSNFVRRSRIIGGISPATLVFQSKIGGGTLKTAEKSHHPYFIPPLNVFNKSYNGAAVAVRNGASLYYSPKDIESAYSDDAVDVIMKKSNVDIKKSEKEKSPEIRLIPRDNFESDMHYNIYRIIHDSGSKIAFDTILHKSEADITELNEILLDLEIEGIIAAAPGSHYMLK